MELRSTRVLKRGKPDTDSSLENEDTSDEKKVSVSSDKPNSGKKRAIQAEIGACVGNVDENLEIGCINGSKCIVSEGLKDGLNTDNKRLFLGSEVLDPIKYLVVSCPEGEIEEESVERAQLDSSGGGGEEENKPMSINLSEMDIEIKEKLKSPNTISDTSRLDCENRSEHVESEKLADAITNVDDNDDMEPLDAMTDDSFSLNGSKNADNGTDKSKQKKGKGQRARKRRKKGNLKKNESDDDSDTTSKEIEGVNGGGGGLVKCKRRRKRKNVETFVCNGDGVATKEEVDNGGVQVNRRVLRSRTMNISGGMVAVDGGSNRTDVGLKRARESKTKDVNTRPKKKIERRGRPRKVQIETTASNLFKTKDESTRPNKKVERRGRPRKVQGSEATPSHVVTTDGTMIEMPKKKLERRGRPRKVHYETMPSNEISLAPMKSRGRGRPRKIHKDLIFKKLKRRERSPKVDSRTLATHVIKMRTVKLMAVKKGNNNLKGNNIVRKSHEVQKIETENDSSEVTHVKTEENLEPMVKVEGDNAGKGLIGKHTGKKKRQQLVRDKMTDILLKAGWIIDLRPRQERAYMDSVYIEPSGKSHWSITRAYAKLRKKVEDGDADPNETSAFIPIPEEEMSLLFRFVDKEKGYKKKKKIGQQMVTNREKKKDGSKSKHIRNSAARLVNRSSSVRKNSVISETRKPRLLARGSEKGSKQDDNGGLAFIAKRNLLSWMIDSGVISSGSKVQYGKTRRQKRSSEGVITDDGICCSCCNGIMGLSRFVNHAGGKPSQCFDNVYLESGTSFQKCLLDSWRKEEESNTIGFNLVNVKGDDPNDDTCNICGDGGNLICCDGCPSTFHQSCLDIQNFPSGDWNCIYCSCKFCGVVSICSPEADECHDTHTSEMLSCCLCEEKFHRLCLQEEVEGVNKDSSGLSFCGRKCQEIFERLQTYIGVKHELEDGFSWTLLQRCDVGQDFSFHDAQSKVECNSKLAVAFSVMDECFVPIADERSETNIIRNVVYNCGSNFRRLNYAGFLTAVLEKDDEFVTAASIRIHGYRLAEMPFIGTRHMYRRQGMCRRLLDAIENTLSCIGVEELVIPAIPALLQTWTNVFGFMPLEESKKKSMKRVNMIVFPGIEMLHKPLLHHHSPHIKPTPSKDYKEKPVDPAGTADVINHEQAEETTVLMDGCSCPRQNDKNAPQVETTSSNAISPTKVGKDAVDYEQKEPIVLMDGCSCPEQNDRNAPQLETTSSNAIGPTRAGKDAIDYEEKEVPIVLMDDCSCPEQNDKNAPQVETTSSHAIDPTRVGKDVIENEQKEEPIVLMDGCSCAEQNDENAPQLETSILMDDKLTISHGANTLCDLNFPVKNLSCQVTDTPRVISIDSTSETPMQYDLNDSDVQTTDGPVVNASPLTSNVVMKNTFDLNLDPTVVGDDSVPNEPQGCIKSFELSESTSQVDRGSGSQPDSKPCDSQPLVLL